MTMVDKTIGDDDLVIADAIVQINVLTYTGTGDLVLTHPRVTAYVQDVHVSSGGRMPPRVRWEPTFPNLKAPQAALGRSGYTGTDASCAALDCGLHAGGGGGGGHDGNSQDGMVPPRALTPLGYLQIKANNISPPTVDVLLWDGVPGYGVDGANNAFGGNTGGNGGEGDDCGFCELDAGVGGDGGNGGNGGNGSDGGEPSNCGYFYIFGRNGTDTNVKVVPRGPNKAGLGTAPGPGGIGGIGSSSGAPGKPGIRGTDGKPSTVVGKPITVIDLSKPVT